MEYKLIRLLSGEEPDIIAQVAQHLYGILLQYLTDVDTERLFSHVFICVETNDRHTFIKHHPKTSESVFNDITARIAVHEHILGGIWFYESISVIAHETATIGRNPYETTTILINGVNPIVRKTNAHVEKRHVVAVLPLHVISHTQKRNSDSNEQY